jgi:hypothetical protein
MRALLDYRSEVGDGLPRFIQNRAKLFGAEAVLKTAGMYGDPPTDMYDGTVQFARDFVRAAVDGGAWPDLWYYPPSSVQPRAIKSMADAIDATLGTPDEAA